MAGGQESRRSQHDGLSAALLGVGRSAPNGIRWLILILSCLGLFGSYYVFDIPSALNVELSSYMGLSSFEYNLLYTVYSAPNCIIPLFGGFLTDKLGYRRCLLIFALLVLLGQAVFTFGVVRSNFYICLAGRFVFGLGGESLTVANSALLAIVFSHAEVALAMAVSLTISRFGSVANNNLSALMYRTFGIGEAVALGTVFTTVSLICIIAMVAIDVVYRNPASSAEEIPETRSVVDDESRSGAEPDAAGLIESVSKMPLIFWLLCGSCVVVYSTILPFNDVAEALLEQRNGYSSALAVLYMSIPFTISALTSPFLGALIDNVGKRGICLTASAALLVFAHAMFAATSWSPLFPLIMMGAAYSIFAAAIWPCVAIVVDQEYLGTAYGIATAIQNVGLAGIPGIVGLLHDRTGSYTASEVFLSVLAALGALIGVAINTVDRKSCGGALNRRSVDTTDDQLRSRSCSV
ncbi:Lysosomal dipeptide transporter MFSD1 [Plasmodiophora brassicae]